MLPLFAVDGPAEEPRGASKRISAGPVRPRNSKKKTVRVNIRRGGGGGEGAARHPCPLVLSRRVCITVRRTSLVCTLNARVCLSAGWVCWGETGGERTGGERRRRGFRPEHKTGRVCTGLYSGDGRKSRRKIIHLRGTCILLRHRLLQTVSLFIYFLFIVIRNWRFERGV